MPRVTVIIATYNWSAVLPYSIGSVLRQTFRDFELLVIGDACTDDSAEVVNAIGDPRVRWINLAENTRHQSGPNNEGLRQARGEIIAYLGHDDLWLPHHLEQHVQTYDRTSCDAAFSFLLLVPPQGPPWPEIPRPFSSTSAITHRRRVTEELGGWGDYRKTSRTPDADLYHRIRDSGRKFPFVPRLTAIKFPASWRRDAYRTRSAHEQAEWLARIDAEPDFEARMLVQLITAESTPDAVPYRELLRHVWKQTVGRIRRRFTLPRGRSIDEVRQFKGVDT